MIAINNCSEESKTCWQDGFVDILPEIERRLRRAFHYLDGEAREDSTEDAVILCLFAYVRLFEQGRRAAASPSNLAWYAALQVKRGRSAGCRMNVREPLSRYAQLGKGIRMERLQTYSATADKWVEAIVEDKRSSVADQVAARMDIGAWLAILPQRMKQIARDLAYGYSTKELAKKHCVTAGRISQLKRELEHSWAAFQHENAPTLA